LTAAKRCSDVRADRDVVAVNARSGEIMPGGAAAFIEDATKYLIFGRR
jgi:hypothetical protein